VFSVLFFGAISAWCLSPAPAKDEGQILFQHRCGACHALDQDAEGPRLRDVYGRTAGSLSSFEYSDALKRAGITWNAESLQRWLADPEQLVPNNGMAFRVEKLAERNAIIDYLKRIGNK
jgi:cytochrome c